MSLLSIVLLLPLLGAFVLLFIKSNSRRSVQVVALSFSCLNFLLSLFLWLLFDNSAQKFQWLQSAPGFARNFRSQFALNVIPHRENGNMQRPEGSVVLGTCNDEESQKILFLQRVAPGGHKEENENINSFVDLLKYKDGDLSSTVIANRASFELRSKQEFLPSVVGTRQFEPSSNTDLATLSDNSFKVQFKGSSNVDCSYATTNNNLYCEKTTSPLTLVRDFERSSNEVTESSFYFERSSNEELNQPIDFILGIDGISLFFIILTTFLIPVCLLVGWTSIGVSYKEYAIAFLVMESCVIAVFSVLDLLLFYIFFESVLIPMFIIIGVWGSRERKIQAAYGFFLYTLAGSLLMLLAVLAIGYGAGSCSLETLYLTSWSEKRSIFLWLAFFASFAVKVPMLPVHIWLPEAHVEAPTAGSVLLAGIMLKLGSYGFLRFSIALFPEASIYFTPLIATMSILAIIYTSLTTVRQVDLKKIIAYSSVAHMNFVTLGLFTLNSAGIQGSILLMLSHGIVSPALFLLVGALYDRHKTRILRYYGGLAMSMPIFATLLLFFTMANISLPGTSSFVGEILVLTGAFQNNTFAAILAATGMVLGAAYALWLCNRVLYGFPKVDYIKAWSDLSRREFWMFVPFLFIVIVMGLAPEIFLNVLNTSVGNILQSAKQ